jgi:hypothetical protein
MMKAEEILFTDGQDVTVTYSTFLVKKKWYSLSSITRHGLSILSPIRLSFVLLLMVGLILSMAGLLNFIPESARNWSMTLMGILINAKELALYVGIVVTLLALLLMLFVPARYALTITTEEGEKNVVVSRSKEHVNQIIHALNVAFLAHVKSGGNKTSVSQKYMVSAR